MDADGSHVRQITNASARRGPFFSPDNKWIIFRSDRQEKAHAARISAIAVDAKTRAN